MILRVLKRYINYNQQEITMQIPSNTISAVLSKTKAFRKGAGMRLLLSVMTVFLWLQANAADFSDETLHYVVSYKWGIIHKDAGTATLTLKNSGNHYYLKLTGKTKSWADSFYQVRDTLIGKVKKNGFRPESYSKIAHEDGKYSRDDIIYSYGGSTVGGHAHRVKIDKKGNMTQSEKKFTASGRVYDMLSVFYFLRTLDYSEMTSGHSVKATMFSGSKVENLTIRCVGKETVKLRDKSKREAYHIKFRFTTQGQKKSSDDIDAWISTDASHIPLQIVGSLPIGQVKCYYIP